MNPLIEQWSGPTNLIFQEIKIVKRPIELGWYENLY